jgi:hypothetical protein
MPNHRVSFGLAKLGNDIYVFGGETCNDSLNSADVFRLNKNEWNYVKELPRRSSDVSAATWLQKIYLTGHNFRNVTVYNPETKKYILLSAVPCDSFSPIVLLPTPNNLFMLCINR